MRKLCLLVCTCLLAGACNDLFDENIVKTRSASSAFFYYPDLSESKIEIVERATQYLFWEYSGGEIYEIERTLYNKNVTLREDPTINDPGAYSFGTIRIRDISDLANHANNRILQEELFHFYQDLYYGGTELYQHIGRVNIEFEAKLLLDYLYINFHGEDMFSTMTVGVENHDEYRKILIRISESLLLDRYDEMIRWFMRENPRYSSIQVHGIRVGALVQATYIPFFK